MRSDLRATYRVQLREEFDFDAAAAIVPYLQELGVSHLYCSPYMQAAARSPHGYDVVDPGRVSRELGGDAGLRRLDRALRNAKMGQLLDVVPNHMCIADRTNTWWWDVLRAGRES
ncbi:MAG TPA: alpha-amylase family glycosyl hydrolase, partial [Galbitalea sp.]